MKSGLSIGAVITTLGAASVLIAAALAGFGLLGLQAQLDARKHIVVLEQALENHSSSDAFMDSARTDVLRALQNALGANLEGSDAIRTNLDHHIEQLTSGIAENQALPMDPSLHDNYERIAALLPEFNAASRQAVELALKDPTAGAANFELFRHRFTAIEELMDRVRDIVHVAVQEVRKGGTAAARRGRWMIILSFAGGATLLAFNTWVAVRLGHRITSDLANSREEAWHLARHDTLTELPNRGYLAERLREDLVRSQRENTRVGVFCIDLDRFKQVNDSFGHPVGDMLLQAVADRLRGCVRRCDTVARLGGDEFAIIQSPIETPQHSEALADRIVAVLSEPYSIESHHVVIGASVGIALASSDNTGADLFKMADLALYRAKAAGRGRACLFDAPLSWDVQNDNALQSDATRLLVTTGPLS